MSDMSSPDVQIGYEKPLVLQNLDFFRNTIEPNLYEDLSHGFYTNSAIGSIAFEDAGVCLRGKDDTKYLNKTRRTIYDPEGKLVTTQNIIIETKNLPDGNTTTRTIEFFRGPASASGKPTESIDLITADKSATKEMNQKAVKEVLDGYLSADVYDKDTELAYKEIAEKTNPFQMRPKKAA